jgi:hypothetical protein
MLRSVLRMPELQLLGPGVHAPLRITQNTRSCGGLETSSALGPRVLSAECREGRQPYTESRVADS